MSKAFSGPYASSLDRGKSFIHNAGWWRCEASIYCGARFALRYTAPLGASGAWLRKPTYLHRAAAPSCIGNFPVPREGDSDSVTAAAGALGADIAVLLRQKQETLRRSAREPTRKGGWA